jgi:hypothetical protein
MSGAIVPQWLTSLDTMKSLLQFLFEPGISALTKDIYNVNFHPGVHGSYVYPESACTKDDGSIYYTYIFGRVCLPVVGSQLLHRRTVLITLTVFF